MVGTRGFEPPTTCTPSMCATRLRYVPTPVMITLLFCYFTGKVEQLFIIVVEQSQYFDQLPTDLSNAFPDLGKIDIFRPARKPADFPLQLLAGTGDGVALLIKKLLNKVSDFNVSGPVDSLAHGILLRIQVLEFHFPVAQGVRLDLQHFAHFANLECLFFRNLKLHGRLKLYNMPVR